MSGAACLASFVERFGPEGALSIWREANLENSTVLPGPFVHRYASRCANALIASGNCRVVHVKPWRIHPALAGCRRVLEVASRLFQLDRQELLRSYGAHFVTWACESGFQQVGNPMLYGRIRLSPVFTLPIHWMHAAAHSAVARDWEDVG